MTGAAPAAAALVEPALPARNEVRPAKSQVRAVKLEEQRATRQRLPELSFSGDVGALGEGPDHALWTSTAPSPLWTSGRIDTDGKAARARAGQAGQRLRAVRLEVSQ